MRGCNVLRVISLAISENFHNRRVAIMLLLYWTKRTFRVGVSSGELMDKEHAIQKSAPMELSLKTDEVIFFV